MKTTTTLLLTSLFGVVSASAAVTLNPTADSDVYQMSNMPTGTVATLGVNSSAGQGHSQKSLIQFNVTGINATEVQSATLRLYVMPASGGFGAFTAGNVSVYSQATSWNVASLNWSSFSAGSSLGSIAVTSASTDETPVWVELDVTAIVKSWANGTTTNNGFLLQSGDEMVSQSTSFASMETGFQPQLVITTGAPVPEPSAMVLVAAGVAGMAFRRRRN